MERTIDLSLTHEQYEQIVSVLFTDGSSYANKSFKEIFAYLRRKHRLGRHSSHDSDDAFHNEWHTDTDDLYIKYTLDKEKSTTSKPIITHAIITYEFTSQSKFYIDFVSLLYKVVDTIPENAIQRLTEQTQIIDTTNISGRPAPFIGADLWCHHRLHELLKTMPDYWNVEWT